MYVQGVGGGGCCFATAAAAGAAAAADLSVIVLFVLWSLFVLYSCGLVIAPVGELVVAQGGIFVVVSMSPIAWNITNDLYEIVVIILFLVVLDLGLGLIQSPAGRRICLVDVIVLLFLSVVLCSAIVVVACIKVDVLAAAAAVATSSLYICDLLLGF